MTDDGLQALASLKAAPFLHTLSLHLASQGDESRTNLTHQGFGALANLKEAPHLHTLSLNLSDCSVGDAGAEAVAGLKEAPRLHTLCLNLSRNQHKISESKSKGLVNSQALQHASYIFSNINQVLDGGPRGQMTSHCCYMAVVPTQCLLADWLPETKNLRNRLQECFGVLHVHPCHGHGQGWSSRFYG